MPFAMRLIHNGSQLLQSKGRNVIEYSIFAHSVTPIAVDLNPIRPIHDLFAHCLASAVRPIHHLHAIVRP